MKDITTCKLFVDRFSTDIDTNAIKNANKILLYITKYIDKNSSTLFDIGPITRLYFGDSEREFIFDTLNIDVKDITKAIEECPAIDKNWKISANEFNLLMVLLIRAFAMKKKKKEAEYCLSYLACSLYSSIHFKYFKYEPNRNVMTYTINNLSNKYLIKQLGSLYKAIHATAVKSHDTYKEDLIEGTDKNIVDYTNNLKTRLDNLIKNIAKEFYDNLENKNYLNTEQDNYDEDEYYVADNTSFGITRLADKTMIHLLTRGLDHDIVKKSAGMCGVSVNVVRNALNDLISSKDEELKELVLLILQLYLMDGKNNVDTVGSTRFIVNCLDIYGKNNTTDDSILRIKELLDKWLEEASVQYRKTERVATLSAYRKSIYVYFIFLITKSTK